MCICELDSGPINKIHWFTKQANLGQPTLECAASFSELFHIKRCALSTITTRRTGLWCQVCLNACL